MAIRATFTGDITDLRRGTQAAREEFRKVGTDAQGAARQLKAVGSSFDGSRLEGQANRIASGVQRIGGVARLTDTELSRNSRTISEVLQKYDRMGTEAPAHIRKLSNELRSAQAAARQLDTATSGIGSKLAGGGGALLSGLGLGIGAGAGLGAITAIGTAISGVVSEAAKLATLAPIFQQMSGGALAAQSKLQDLRAATNGLVSDSALMQSSNQATVLGLDRMGIKFTDVARVATVLGRAVGQDTTQAVSDLTNGLAKGSAEVLNNLGVIIRSEDAYRAYAERIGTTADALTDVQRQTAVATIGFEQATAKARELGDVPLTTGQNWDRLLNAITSIGTLGAGLADKYGPFHDLLAASARAAESIRDSLGRVRPPAGFGPGATGGAASYGASGTGLPDWTRLDAPPPISFVSAGAGGVAMIDGRIGERQAAAQARETRGVAEATAALARATGQRADAEDRIAEIQRRQGFGAAAVLNVNAIKEAVVRLTAAQRDAIREAKNVGASNKEAAAAAGTTEQVVRAFVAMEAGAKKATAATTKLHEEFEKLTGQQAQQDATRLAEAVIAFSEAGGTIPSDKVEAVAKQLMAARNAAFEAGQETITLRRALDSLLIPSKRIDGLLRADSNLQSSISGAARNAIATAAQTTGVRRGFTSDIIAGANPFAGQLVGLAPTVDVAREAFERIEASHRRLATSTRDWRVEVTNIAQALGQLGQIAGTSLDPMTRSIGLAISSLNAGEQLVTSIGEAFNKNFDFGKSQSGQLGATALGAGIAGWQIGTAAGLSPWRAAGAGALSGAGQGAMYGGAGFAVGAIVGATSSYFGAQKAESELRKQKDLQMQQLVAQYGSLDALLEAVGRLGLNQHTFLQQYYGEPKQFAAGVTALSNALTRESAEATKLSKALQSVSQVQGVLSRQQLGAIRNIRGDGPGAEAVVEFAAQQRAQAEAGLTSAIAAIAPSLTDAETEELTRGITDAAERARVIEAELVRRSKANLERFGAGAQAAASGLYVAFSDAIRQGESALTVLARLKKPIEDLQKLYERAGKAPGAGFQQLQVLSGIATAPETAPAVQLAQGLGQALAGFANTGLLSPELFGELANGIGGAYKQLELMGKGGLEAARLMQPGLQAIWQMIQDNPTLRDELDDTTLSLLEFAEDAGLIGEDFRPAMDLMLDKLDDLIDKIGDLIDAIADVPGVNIPVTYTPGELPPPPGGGTPPDVPALAAGGIVRRPTLALIGEQGPEAVIPLSRLGGRPGDIVPLSRSGATSAPLQITVISQIDGYEAARAITRRQPDVYRTYGAA